MWAQLVKARAKAGKEEEIRNLTREFEAQAGGGSPPWTYLFACSSQNEPSVHYTFVVFESEAAARQNESSPEQEKRMQRFQELFEGQPEYVDLIVEEHRSR